VDVHEQRGADRAEHRIRVSPIAGIVTGTPTATTLFGHIYNDTTAAKTIATGTLAASVNHFCRFRIMLKNGTGTS
jgi:hypothetical protein